MEDERDQGDEEQNEGFTGNLLLPPHLGPGLFEIAAQSAVGSRQGIEAFLDSGTGGRLRSLRLLLQRTAAP